MAVTTPASVYDFRVPLLTGTEQNFADYRGKVLVIVNVASKCGFTPQYADLQSLYDRLHDRGLEILGFPCNQFGEQEPGTATEIAQFCSTTYGVSFPIFQKIDVNGPDAHPLYAFLRKSASGIFGDAIKWNFTKFLVDKDGTVVQRFAPNTAVAEVGKAVEKLL